MRTANWQDYDPIDTSGGERLQRSGGIMPIRPDPHII